MKSTRINFIKKEFVLFIFFLLLIVLSLFHASEIINFPSFVDWQTIKALAGLLIITTGLKESRYLFSFSKKLLTKLKTERSISLFMVLLSASLSTFLTNDITLFITIPLTFSMNDIVKIDIKKLVIFEAIAVNVGSTLTPVGNPQNLFLWHKWNISIIKFIIEMFPLVLLLLGILLIFTWITFPRSKVKFLEESNRDLKQDKMLFVLSIVFLIIYIISLEIRHVDLVLLLVFVIFFLFYRKVLLNVDWLLLLLFIVIFIDFHIISTLSIASTIMNTADLHSEGGVFLLSVFISQIFSNVPASVLLSKFTHNWRAITYGVNVGGNGLILSSLANIIAMRMLNEKRAWMDFHKYSIPYLIVSGGIVYVIFYILLVQL